MKINQIIKLNHPVEFPENTFNAVFNSGDKDEHNVIIYMPEVSKNLSGINFVNKYRKKSVFDEAFILPIYSFYNKKLNAQKYIKEFRQKNPNVPVVKKLKMSPHKTSFIDLTPLMELFLITSNIIKFKSIKLLFEYINKLIQELKINPDNTYIIYHGNNEQSNFIDIFYKLLRKRKLQLPFNELNVQSIIGYGEYPQNSDKIWLYPLTEKVEINKETVHKLKIPVYNLYRKQILELQEIKDQKSVDEIQSKISEIKDNLNVELDKIIKNKSKKDVLKELESIAKNSEKEGTKEIKDSSIDIIFQELIKINPENDIQKNIEYLKEELKKDPENKELIKKLDEFNKYLNEINEKYNGVIKIDKEYLQKFSNSFFDPTKIVGFDSLNVYNRQKTEFDEVLDNSMFDLIKSLERDKEAGIKVLDINTEIVDTNKDRLKIYKVKIKNTKFGKEKPYEIKMHVPYPIKEKYLKIGGNTYVMVNQFFPKPVLKVKPNIVRLYTHYTTSAVSLQTSVINETDDVKSIIDNFIKMSKPSKNTKGVEFLDDKELQEVNLNLEKFNIKPFKQFYSKKIDVEL